LPGLAVLFTLVTVFLASCTIPLTPVNTPFRSYIFLFDLDVFVLPPEAGAVPRSSLDIGYYTIKFDWFDESGTKIPDGGKFDLDKKYHADLTITPHSYFFFQNPETNKGEFKYSKGIILPNSRVVEGDSIKLTIEFDKTEKVKTVLLDLRAIKAPENGADPVTSLTGGTGYQAPEGVQWFEITNEGKVEFSGPFENGAYTARVKLKTRSDRYSFEGLKRTGITHVGSNATLEPEDPGEDCDDVTAEIEFLRAGTNAINEIDLRDTAPVAENDSQAEPSSNDEAYYGISNIGWSEDKGKSFTFTGLFKMEREYWARLTLIPRNGYEFGNLAALGERIKSGGTPEGVELAEDKKTIHIIIRYDPLKAAITKLDLSRISAPKAGNPPAVMAPDLNMNGLPFTVESIVWDPELSDGKFEGEKVYKAKVEVKVKPEYNFEGLNIWGIASDGNIESIYPGVPNDKTTKVTVTITFGQVDSGPDT
jgi:hypothetical protein